MKTINCILLVDNFDADNYYNSIILKNAGLCNHLKTAISGIEALEYLKNASENDQHGSFPIPDILFLDINMPGMNGFEFLEEFKKLDEKLKSSVVIVLLTTFLNSEDRKRALQYKEIKEILIKPLTIEVFNQLIEKHF
ncbi:MAG TPA: response regulator [Prolixibacteraceae bacterium]|nr:response regulator [Prolixibacteraceae bacterium]